MRQLFVGIIAALVLVRSVPLAPGQDNAAVQEKPASSTPQRVTCDALLQHPLAWWLGSMPTPAERDQLATCLAGSGQQAPASPLVSAAPSAAMQDKPADWNTLTAMEQAHWLCRDDPSRITNRCKMVPVASQTAVNSSVEKPANWNMMGAMQLSQMTERVVSVIEPARDLNTSSRGKIGSGLNI